MRILAPAVLAAVLAAAPGAAYAHAQAQASVVEDAQARIRAGDLAGGIADLERAVAAAPREFGARIALGRALDLAGRHPAARRHLEEAVQLASGDQREAALLALGVSYAFEAKADEAARYYQRVFDARMQADNRAGAAAAANALGRIYLESGNLQKAEQWYTTGYATARDIQGLEAADRTLWEMRRHHAFGRIAARRKQAAVAQEHADAVKALLDKGGHENQRPFYPYLLGYIAFARRDYAAALEHLLQGDLEDPFVLGLIAQSYERTRQRGQAAEYHRKVLAQPVHNINAAFARPAARKFLRQ